MSDGSFLQDPETMPWLIDLDHFIDGQSHDGLSELVVRSNGTATSLNEAVALELLQLAGLGVTGRRRRRLQRQWQRRDPAARDR